MQAAARYSSPVSVGPGGGRRNNHRMGAAHRQRRCGVGAVPLPVPPGAGAGEKWTSPRVKNRRPPCCQFPAPPPPLAAPRFSEPGSEWSRPLQVQRAHAAARAVAFSASRSRAHPRRTQGPRGNEPAAHRAAARVLRRPHTTTLVKSRHVAGELSRAAV